MIQCEFVRTKSGAIHRTAAANLRIIFSAYPDGAHEAHYVNNQSSNASAFRDGAVALSGVTSVSWRLFWLYVYTAPGLKSSCLTADCRPKFRKQFALTTPQAIKRLPLYNQFVQDRGWWCPQAVIDRVAFGELQPWQGASVFQQWYRYREQYYSADSNLAYWRTAWEENDDCLSR